LSLNKIEFHENCIEVKCTVSAILAVVLNRDFLFALVDVRTQLANSNLIILDILKITRIVFKVFIKFS